MWNILFLALISLTIEVLTTIGLNAKGAADFEMSPKIGKYLCVSDFAVGIIRETGKPTYAGQIQLPEEKNRFFISITQKSIDKQSCSVLFYKIEKYRPLAGTLNQHTDKCLAEIFSTDNAKSSSECSTPDPSEVINSCLSYFEITSDSWIIRSMNSSNGTAFSNSVASFRINDGGKFSLTENIEGSTQVVQGKCEFIK